MHVMPERHRYPAIASSIRNAQSTTSLYEIFLPERSDIFHFISLHKFNFSMSKFTDILREPGKMSKAVTPSGKTFQACPILREAAKIAIHGFYKPQEAADKPHPFSPSAKPQPMIVCRTLIQDFNPLSHLPFFRARLTL